MFYHDEHIKIRTRLLFATPSREPLYRPKVSLFTKVPVELSARVAHKRLLADTSLAERTSLSPDEVVNFLRLCLGATYLSYRGEVYQQTFGTAMGSPVSVTVTNLVMEDVE